ncbi:DUF6351 family protein [Plantactinospora solaniradicis]|uniref:DUF6351 family protein n=2 Tax=Plantactinospora solaniradicis TaxID=1723736 RepID=A0ABW1KQA7_9ACTN
MMLSRWYRAIRLRGRSRAHRRALVGFAATTTVLGLAVTMAVPPAAWATPAAGAGPAAGAKSGGHPELTVLSGRADMVSGGNALVQVALPRGARVADLRVTVERNRTVRDVTRQFALRADGRVTGLVDGLPEGRSVLVARVDHGDRAQLPITNYPIAGPIFSGPHNSPYVCETETAGLGPAIDANCLAPTRYDYFYRSSADNTFHPYDPGSATPSDVASTTTNDGKTVPYIVRVESGVINRSIYRIGVLFNPQGQAWQPWAPQPGWARKVMYVFGPGCGAGYRQGSNAATEVLDDFALSQGWAVVVSTLNIAGTHCQSALTAETTMMIKEHLTERYGQPRYVMGFGGSGGSWSQHVIAEQYPGLLDGIVPQYGFLDFNALLYGDQVDCALFGSYYAKSPQLWADLADRNAVEGRDYRVCQDAQAGRGLAQVQATARCPNVLPQSSFYHPVTNPDGIRCAYPDANVNLLGRRKSDGFANRPFDNVGIQYGLGALADGTITPEQFVDLNEKVGGYDIDGNPTAGRSEADFEALRLSYQNDLVTSGVGLRQTPIIDISVGDTQGDTLTGGHEQVFNTILRQRLKAANGTAANQVIFTSANAGTRSGTDTDIGRTALRTMDQWLAGIERDTSAVDRATKVIRNKPAGAVDRCWDRANTPADPAFCAENAPVRGIPRMVAGQSPRFDVLKCRLEPLKRGDYDVRFTDEQWSRLVRTFRTGVCDWSKPSVGNVGHPRQWVSYAAGPQGTKIGRAPVSTPGGGR